MNRAEHKRLVTALTWSALALVMAAAGIFAGYQFAPSAPQIEISEPITYQVVLGSVNNELRFEAQATWPLTPWVVATRSGIVTSINVPENGFVDAGDVLLTVGLSPVVAIPGEIPASRDLALNSSGPDVAQIQEFLAKIGKLEQVTGTFNAATRQAVIAWQQENGFIPADGIVRQGDVAFFPELPTTVAIPSQIVVGGLVSAGQGLIEAVTGNPVIEIITGAEQAALIPQEQTIIASVGGYSWPGRFGYSYTENNLVHIPVVADNGEPICSADCSTALQLGLTTRLTILVVQVPFTEGPVVPVSSLRTLPTGQVVVTQASGIELPVTILASHGGVAVVEGVAVGTEILVFGNQ